MPRFRTRDGSVELQVGDDVQLTVADALAEGGERSVTGQVTSVRPEENAVWVRGVRVDLDTATLVHDVGTHDPRNLTPPPG